MAILIDRPVERAPGFGTRILGPFNDSSSTTKKVALAAGSILGCAAMVAGGVFGGVFVGAGVGVVGAVVLGGSVLIDKAVVSVKKKKHAVELVRAEQRRARELAAAGPGLGVESPANLRLCSRVEDSLQWKLDLIKSAETSIELSPNFAGGRVFQEVLRAIEIRMAEKPDLRVHIIVSKDLLWKGDLKKLARLKSRFRNRFVFLTTPRKEHWGLTGKYSIENHTKLLIVDEKYFAIGGSGLDKKMTSETPVQISEKHPSMGRIGFRDMDVIGEGDVAQTMRHQFFELFHKWEKKVGNKKARNRFFAFAGVKGTCLRFHDPVGLFSQKRVSFLVSGREHRKASPILQAVSSRIQAATREVRIASFVFNFPRSMRKALAKRDLQVMGYTSGVRSKTGWFQKVIYVTFKILSQSHYGKFTKVCEASTPNQFYHRKVMTIDGQEAIIGTHNWGIKSAYLDDEALLFIKDPEFTAAVNASLDEDEARSTVLQGNDLKISAIKRAVSFCFFRIFSRTWG